MKTGAYIDTIDIYRAPRTFIIVHQKVQKIHRCDRNIPGKTEQARNFTIRHDTVQKMHGRDRHIQGTIGKARKFIAFHQ